jgi:hypothetical protein
VSEANQFGIGILVLYPEKKIASFESAGADFDVTLSMLQFRLTLISNCTKKNSLGFPFC